MSDPQLPIVTPDPTKVAIMASQLHMLLSILSGAGLIGGAWAGMSQDQLANDISAFLVVGGVVAGAASSMWSWYKTHWVAQEKHATAVASAVASAQATQDAGRPVAVTVAAIKPA